MVKNGGETGLERALGKDAVRVPLHVYGTDLKRVSLFLQKDDKTLFLRVNIASVHSLNGNNSIPNRREGCLISARLRSGKKTTYAKIIQMHPERSYCAN